jgi:hypothetical protein
MRVREILILQPWPAELAPGSLELDLHPQPDLLAEVRARLR